MCKFATSPEQGLILESVFRCNFVIACPGSGKTTLMMQKIMQLLENNIKPEEILGLSFTRSSVKDVKKRMCEQLQGVADSITVKTFHGFCRKDVMGDVSDDEAIYISFGAIKKAFPFITSVDQIRGGKYYKGCGVSFCGHFISEMRLKEFEERLKMSSEGKNSDDIDPFMKNYLRSRSQSGIEKFNDAFKGNNRAGGSHNFHVDELGKCYKRYCRELDAGGRLDFEAVIYKWITGTYNFDYKYIFIDEFQDINELEKSVITKIIPKCKYFLAVGDPNQSIYDGRSCVKDVFVVGQKIASDSFPHEEVGVFQMTKNFRSTLEICCFSEGIHSISTETTKSIFDRSSPIGNSVHIWPTEGSDEDGFHSLSSVLRQFQGEARAHDVLVLFRTNGQKVEALKKIRSIKTEDREEGGFLQEFAVIEDTKSVGEIYADEILFQILFEYIFNLTPTNRKNTLKEILLRPWGDDEEGAKGPPALEIPHFPGDSSAYYSYSKEQIHSQLRDILKQIFQVSSDSLKYFRTIEKKIGQFSRLVHINLEKRVLRPFNIINVKEAPPLSQQNKKKIIFSTVHAAKGLEADWCIYFFENRSSTEAKRTGSGKNDVNEEIRVNFVGITRGKFRLTLIGQVAEQKEKRICQNEPIFNENGSLGIREAKHQYQKCAPKTSLFINGRE